MRVVDAYIVCTRMWRSRSLYSYRYLNQPNPVKSLWSSVEPVDLFHAICETNDFFWSLGLKIIHLLLLSFVSWCSLSLSLSLSLFGWTCYFSGVLFQTVFDLCLARSVRGSTQSFSQDIGFNFHSVGSVHLRTSAGQSTNLSGFDQESSNTS